MGLDTPNGGTQSQADALIELASSAELFHTPDGVSYADIYIDEYRQTIRVRSRGFRHCLGRRWFDKNGGAPSSSAMTTAIEAIDARAQFDSPERRVFVRIGCEADRIYIDLGDPTWRAIEVDSDGWRIIGHPPVRFRRAIGLASLPAPIADGTIELLHPFVNLPSDEQFVLWVAWLLAGFRGTGPYPLLVLSGEQGSSKSTLSKISRELLDPNTAPLRALPRGDRDLFIAAGNAHVLAFDNVSRLPDCLSDSLCRIASGGGFATRRLRPDDDETLFDAARPVIINGIADMIARPDLADRSIFLTLGPIAASRRRAESEFWAEFEAARPRILGALLDAVVVGLKHFPEIRLTDAPRMADFAHWGTACETAFWPSGRFLKAYDHNRRQAIADVIAHDSVASAVCALAVMHARWRGTASQLREVLRPLWEGESARSKDWPGSAQALTSRLRRAQTFLRAAGIEVSFERRGHAGTRIIEITRSVTFSSAGEDG
jgi:hypothetical protein